MTKVLMPSGKYFDISNPKVEDIKIDDILTCLNRIYRFAGSSPLTVAAHSYLVHELVDGSPHTAGTSPEIKERIKKLALLHDAHEAYIGDIIRPVVEYMSYEHTVEPIANLKQSLDYCIHKAFNVELPNFHEREIIKELDDEAMGLEIKLINYRITKNLLTSKIPAAVRTAMYTDYDKGDQYMRGLFSDKLMELYDAKN